MPFFKRRRWEPPEPLCSFLVACAAYELPAVLSLAHPAGAEGALSGFPILRGDERPKGDLTELSRPMRPGEMYAVATPQRGLWGLSVRTLSASLRPERDIWPFIGLSEEQGELLLRSGAEVLVERGDGDAPVAWTCCTALASPTGSLPSPTASCSTTPHIAPSDTVVLELVDDGAKHGIERGLRSWPEL